MKHSPSKIPEPGNRPAARSASKPEAADKNMPAPRESTLSVIRQAARCCTGAPKLAEPLRLIVTN